MSLHNGLQVVGLNKLFPPQVALVFHDRKRNPKIHPYNTSLGCYKESARPCNIVRQTSVPEEINETENLKVIMSNKMRQISLPQITWYLTDYIHIKLEKMQNYLLTKGRPVI